MLSNNRPSGARQAAWLSVICLILCVYIALAAKANVDLSDGRFALFMDERITFDGVRRILHPGDWNSFSWAIRDGGDQRYGRSLWNSIALFSYLPEKLWGVAGQIIAARMAQVFLLAIAFLVMAFGFVQSWPLRTALLVALLSMPYADYYMTMPKPEPLQLLFLAGFLFFAKRNKWNFGWHWIFLGLAFGTKISTLPAIVVLVLVSMLTHGQNDRTGAAGQSSKEALLFFGIGLAIAVPILVNPIGLAILSFWLCLFLVRRWNLRGPGRISLFGATTILVAIASRNRVKSWLDSTLLNTRHGADQDSIDALSWLNYVFDSWLVGPKWLGIVLVAVSAGFVLVHLARRMPGNRGNWMSPDIGFILILCGLLLNLSIFIGVHRLWGFYLFPGSTLMLAGLFRLLDVTIGGTGAGDVARSARFERYWAFGAVGLSLTIAWAFWVPRGLQTFDALAARTKSEEYLEQYSSYAKVLNFLDGQSKVASRKLRVAFDPHLFVPSESEHYQIVEFWGPYSNWEDSPDVIVFGPNHTVSGKAYPSDSPEFKAYLREREGYSKYVINKDDECPHSKCFAREALLPNGGEILTLRKSIQSRGSHVPS